MTAVVPCLQYRSSNSIVAACRNYHHHIVDIMDRLTVGICQKGGRVPVDIADIAQVGPTPPAAHCNGALMYTRTTHLLEARDGEHCCSASDPVEGSPAVREHVTPSIVRRVTANVIERCVLRLDSRLASHQSLPSASHSQACVCAEGEF